VGVGALAAILLAALVPEIFEPQYVPPKRRPLVRVKPVHIGAVSPFSIE